MLVVAERLVWFLPLIPIRFANKVTHGRRFCWSYLNRTTGAAIVLTSILRASQSFRFRMTSMDAFHVPYLALKKNAAGSGKPILSNISEKKAIGGLQQRNRSSCELKNDNCWATPLGWVLVPWSATPPRRPPVCSILTTLTGGSSCHICWRRTSLRPAPACWRRTRTLPNPAVALCC